MALFKEFKEFAVKGNALNLAVGVIIGAAFGKIVSSLVEDILMPPIGMLVGGLDFSNMYISLSEAVDKQNVKLAETVAATQPTDLLNILDTSHRLTLAQAKALGPVVAYGNFITISINFLIVAFCVFMLIKGLNTLARKEEAKAAAPATPPPPPAEQVLLTEIRDILKSK